MYNLSESIAISHAVNALNKKEIIIYPTESVFAIGCDPDSEIAINRLLKIKQRSIEKGLILIAADYTQLKPYIDDTMLDKKQRDIIFNSWPGPITFTFPTKISTPRWLTGNFSSLAVRVTNHKLVIKFCRAFGKPLVSTSANISGKLPCRTVQEIHSQFGKNILLLNGKIDNRKKPSEIRDAITGKYFRYG